MAYYQQHMLSIHSRNILAQILAEITLINETNEAYREAIANSPYFDSLALFRLLDRQEKGYLCEKDLQAVIGTKHRKLLTYAFTWIDALKAGEVSRLEFATFLLPRDNLQLRQLIAQRLQHPEMEYSSKQQVFEQFSIFREMILEIIKREMKLIELRRELLNQKDYSVKGSLLAIDSNRHDWVCAEDLQKFMKNYGYDISLRQVEKLVEVINSSMDGKINEEQLKWITEGLEGSDRSYLERIKRGNRSVPPKKPTNVEEKFHEYRNRSKSKNKQTNLEQQKYSQLMSRLQQVQLQQRKVDQSLLLKQKASIEHMNDFLEQQRLQLQLKKKLLQEEKEKERLILQAKHAMEQEMHHLLQKTTSIEAESQRLARIENRVNIHNDLYKIQRAIQEPQLQPQPQPRLEHRYRENRPPSFGSPQDSFSLYPPQAMTYSEYPTFLNAQQFAADRGSIPSHRMSQSIKKHIENSDLYLQTTRQIKEKIKAEREAERLIREKFNTQEIFQRYKQYKPAQTTQTQRGKPLEGSRQKQPGTIQAGKMELGLESVQKSSIPSASKQDPTKAWQSPQHREVKPSILEKLDMSTGNKIETGR